MLLLIEEYYIFQHTCLISLLEIIYLSGQYCKKKKNRNYISYNGRSDNIAMYD